MTRRSKVWQVVAVVAAVLFFLVNVAGGVYAAARGELLHAGIHAGLLLLGAYPMWRLASRRDAGRIWRRGRPAAPASPPELTDRLAHLEQSVDAVALEVERIGEGQRFVTRLFTENGAPRAAGVGAAEPIEMTSRDAAPHVRSY